jgi:hypothetical protein
MVFVIVKPFPFINEIMHFHKKFCLFIFAKYTFTLKHLLHLENLKVDRPQNHEYITLRNNDQILMSRQLQWKKMNENRMT